MNHIKSLSFYFTVIISLASCGTTVRMNTQYHEYMSKYNDFVAIPCNSEIQYRHFNGQIERLFDDERVCGNNIEIMIRNEMQKKGFIPVKIEQPIDSLDEDFRFKFSRIQEEMDRAFMDLYRKPILTKKKAFNISTTISNDINFFADYYNTDLLVFSKMNGFKNSPGENAKNVGKSILIGIFTLGSSIPIYYSEGGVVFISIVDGNTGNILWSNYIDLHGNLGPNRIHNSLKNLFSKMPEINKN